MNYPKLAVVSVWWVILAALVGAAGFSLLTPWTVNDAGAYVGVILGPPVAFWIGVGLYELARFTQMLWREL